ncbi:TonB-dependent receptor [Nonlabens marinus S1-08]|uniref:TonB-dependent receptor n=1 Tax=Nonlabens marinus S1-08 TaxID=1454201 RepID=W8VX67_9FLAO|nr:TonB-dependent receptor [Nonlabens marinus S1-08]
MSEQFQVQFNYQSELVEGIRVVPLSRKRTLKEHINRLEVETSLQFTKIGEAIFSITKNIKICGYLKDAQSLKALEGATVLGEVESTISASNGFFEIAVSSLEEEITISFLGFKTIQEKALLFDSDNCSNVEMYQQEMQISSIVVEGYIVRGIDKNRDGTTTIDFSKFTSLPGLIETDVLQTVKALPGVQSVDETVSNINIRGGSHDQNLILWDGIKMYQSGHFFGLISSFNPQITKTATVITNGTDVSYTDGVSGTIQMNTHDRIQKEFDGSVGLNFISADVFADLPIGQNSSLQVAARRSVDDVVRTPTYDTYFERVTQQTEIDSNIESVLNSNQNFSFYDTSLRWLYHPSENDRLRFNFILINNDLSFDETSTANKTLESRKSSLSQYSIAAGLSYEREWNDQFSTHFNAYNTDYKLQAVNANILEEQLFAQENSVSETGVSLKGTYKWEYLSLDVGYQFVESEVVNQNDVDVPRFLRRDSEILREHAIFTQMQFQNKDRSIFLRPGVRFNYINKFDIFLIEPRVSLSKKLGTDFQIEMLGELKHQNTSQIINFQNDFLGVEKRRWQLADNENIPILRSKQASLGLQYEDNGWLVDATGYYKEVDGITSQSQSFTTKYEFEKATGSYNIVGVDVLLRKQVQKISSWISYSYMVNEYTFEEFEENQFPSNFDTTHSVTLGTTYSNDVVNISTGLNYRTGKPTSVPLLGNEIERGEVNFDTVNDSRVEDYIRADISALYKLKLSRGLRSELGASIWNVFNTDNVINNFYRINAENTVDKFSRSALGLTTNFMVRLKF